MKIVLLFLCLLGLVQFAYGRPPDRAKTKMNVVYRGDCQPGQSSVDLEINNVRARLLSRGDMWWDYQNAVYVVPKSGGVSSIYAGGVWVGGYDSAGNLHLSAAEYNMNGITDYYPGPLDLLGETAPAVCQEWDQQFVVYGAEITKFRSDWTWAKSTGAAFTEDLIPANMKAYPARGNPFFALAPNGFILPEQELAPFFDNNLDDIYNPMDGDYPKLGGQSCSGVYADQMVFQIFNDASAHKNTNGSPLKLEFQVQSFAFQTTDALNDMTFMRYNILSRSADTIFNTYFSLWIDGDLGCSNDDYVGCDTSRSLIYFYNSDAVDGGGNCQNVNTYGDKIPLQGIDLLRGPTVYENGQDNELSMTSFMYYESTSTFSALAAKTDPNTPPEFYNYMTGRWKDGTALYAGGDGYDDIEFGKTKFAFTGAPNDLAGWSMAQENILGSDFRALMSTGPFNMNPGTSNELVFGLPWVPNVPHPNPSIEALLAADDLAQATFDNCFDSLMPALAIRAPLVLDMVVYPNPTSDYFKLETSDTRIDQIQLMNIKGQVLLSQKLKQDQKISISHLPVGVYTFNILDDKQQLLGVGQISKM